MEKRAQLQEKLDAAIERRAAAQQFSPEWFNAKAEVEALAAQLAKANLKQDIPADFVEIDWEQYDNE